MKQHLRAVIAHACKPIVGGSSSDVRGTFDSSIGSGPSRVKKYRVQDRRGCRRSQGGGDLARARRLAAMVAKATWLVSTAYESATVQTGESDVRTLPSNSSVRRATDRQNRGRLNASASSTVEWILLQRRRFVRGHALGDLPAPSGEIARRLSLCPPACGSLRLMGRRDRV